MKKVVTYTIIVGGVFCVVVLAACVATAGWVADELGGVRG